MRRRAGKGRTPSIGRLVPGILCAVKRRKGKEDGFFLVVFFFIDIFGNAERGADEGRSVTPRIGGRRHIFLGLVTGEWCVKGRRKNRQQREQHREGLHKDAMEAGLTQNQPLPTRQFQHVFTFGEGPRHVKH